MTTIEIFEKTAEIIIKTATNDKALKFAEKIIFAISSKGVDWIESNSKKLELYEANFLDSAPVADNRNFYLIAWQKAIR